MKTLNRELILVLLSGSMIMTGCELAGDIFKAGIWVGVIIVVLIIALFIRLFRKS